MEEKEEDEMSLKNAHGFFICEKKKPTINKYIAGTKMFQES